MAAVHFTTILFEPNTANYALSHILGGRAKFVTVIVTLPILGLRFTKLFCAFYEQFYGFHALPVAIFLGTVD